MYLAPTPPITVTLARAPSGRAGAHHTLALMRSLISEYKKHPDLINTAVSIVFLVPEKDDAAEIDALFAYVRDNVRYLRDVAGVETLADPLTTIRRSVGDCDDKTTLFCTLAECVGYPTRLVMAGYLGEPDYSHVYAQVAIDGAGWVDADCTENAPLGYAPPAPTRRFIERV